MRKKGQNSDENKMYVCGEGGEGEYMGNKGIRRKEEKAEKKRGKKTMNKKCKIKGLSKATPLIEYLV